MKDIFYQELKNKLKENQILLQEKLADHTTLHIGGAADYYILPTTTQEIRDVLCLCKEWNMPFYVMGNGSNLLVSDQGYRGLILHFGSEFAKVWVKEDGTVIAQAGVMLSKLAGEIAKHSLTGFEFASGIPGTLGGAVTMNAGAYDGEIKQCIVGAKVMDVDGNIHDLGKEELELDYRSSVLQKNNYILLEAEFKFISGDIQTIMQRMNELNTLRREKQPLDQFSVGSTFKRPKGNYAGKLIMEAGLRGYQVGDAAVSEKHSGFVINKGNATAKDFITVLDDVIRRVYDQFGIRLEPEVKFLGEF